MRQPIDHTPIRVAIDGPAASGKGSLGRKVAAHFHIPYLDTGLLYRYIGEQILYVPMEDIRMHAIERAHKPILPSSLDPERLSGEVIGKAASIVSAIPEVRSALLDFQRRIAASVEGAVLDGRDIGTVVWPEAEFKFFITANIETRAERRFKELQSKGKQIIYAEVLKDLEERDARDIARAVSPLLAAEGAVHIDTTTMTPERVLAEVLAVIAPEFKASGL